MVIPQREDSMGKIKRGPGLAITHYFDNKQALLKNMSLQDLAPRLWPQGSCFVENGCFFNIQE